MAGEGVGGGGVGAKIDLFSEGGGARGGGFRSKNFQNLRFRV